MLFSLVFVRESSKILLGLKKRGFGKGKWNGFGGKVMPEENIVDCAMRELQEECGLSTTNLHKMGVLNVQYEDYPDLLEIHVFETYEYSGELTESEEMRPVWFDLGDIPFNEMWPDNRHWLPSMLKGQMFKANLLYRDWDVMVKNDIQFVENLP